MTEPGALIVGAGPTGLVLALWLIRLGVKVRLIDRTAEPGTTSRALAVQARTLEFYRQLGIDEEVVEDGAKIENINLWVQGSIAARVPLGRIGEGLSPYPFALVFPQDAHEKLLIEHLARLGVDVERQTELLRFEEHEASVRATIRGPGGVEEVCEAAYLAGCDGASSTVRETLGIGFPGGTYSGMFYVADVEATGLPVDDQLHADLEDADFVLVFPLKGTGHVRLVGTVREGSSVGHDELTFDDVKDKAIHHLRLIISKVNWFSTYRVHHRVANCFRKGRTFLLGDAAHIHSPVGGQGMNTGIGDAVNLAWKLAAVIRADASDKILESYEPERIGFARRLVATTDRAFTVVTKRSRTAQIVRTRIVPHVLPLLFGIPAARRFMFRTVSQIMVNYRGSPLSAGAAGDIAGGDRLPWTEIAPGEDNFAPLTSLQWQAHLYGKARDDTAATCARLRLPLHVFPWQPQMRAAGLSRDALYLIRPDGYIGLADRDADSERLRDYVERLGIEAAIVRPVI